MSRSLRSWEFESNHQGVAVELPGDAFLLYLRLGRLLDRLPRDQASVYTKSPLPALQGLITYSPLKKLRVNTVLEALLLS